MPEIELDNKAASYSKCQFSNYLLDTETNVAFECRFHGLLSVELPIWGLDERATESDERVAQKNVIVREELVAQKGGRVWVRRRGNALYCGRKPNGSENE